MEGFAIAIGACCEGCVGAVVGCDGGEADGCPLVCGAMSPLTSAMVVVGRCNNLADGLMTLVGEGSCLGFPPAS